MWWWIGGLGTLGFFDLLLHAARERCLQADDIHDYEDDEPY